MTQIYMCVCIKVNSITALPPPPPLARFPLHSPMHSPLHECNHTFEFLGYTFGILYTNTTMYSYLSLSLHKKYHTKYDGYTVMFSLKTESWGMALSSLTSESIPIPTDWAWCSVLTRPQLHPTWAAANLLLFQTMTQWIPLEITPQANENMESLTRRPTGLCLIACKPHRHKIGRPRFSLITWRHTMRIIKTMINSDPVILSV